MEILHGSERVNNHTHDAKKIRKMGKIPGILYGEMLQNFMFEIGEMELNKEIMKGGEHGVLDIDISGKEHKTLIKEIQRDPVSGKIIHIDLEEINSNKIIQSEVPVLFTGEDNVSKNGGIIQKEKDSIRVQCKVDNLPKYMNIDLRNSTIGDVFRIYNIEASSEITFLDDINSVIATIVNGNTNMISVDNENDLQPTVIQNKIV